jgi:hypothetical protein
VGLVTPAVALDHVSQADLVRDFSPDVVVYSGCPYPGTGERSFQDGYRFLRAVPWLVFEEQSGGMGLCVFVREDYPYSGELDAALASCGAPVQPLPWYYSLYRQLKQTFSQ